MSAVRHHLHYWEKERRDRKSLVKIEGIGHTTHSLSQESVSALQRSLI
jgi:hypothetical protein